MANQVPPASQLPQFTAVQTRFAIDPLPQGADAHELDQFTTPDNNPVRTSLALPGPPCVRHTRHNISNDDIV